MSHSFAAVYFAGLVATAVVATATLVLTWETTLRAIEWIVVVLISALWPLAWLAGAIMCSLELDPTSDPEDRR
jgi:hypothetical protein